MTINLLKYALNTSSAWMYTGYARVTVRASKSLLGFAWPGLSIIISLLILIPVYSRVIPSDTETNYPIYLLVGLLFWSAVNNSLSRLQDSIAVNTDILLNTQVHPYYYVCEECVFQSLTTVQAIAICLPFTLFLQSPLSTLQSLLLSVPYLLLAPVFLLSLQGITYHLIVRLSEFRNILPLILQVAFLATPILYLPAALGNLRVFLYFNPLFPLLQGFRDAFISFLFSPLHFLLALLVTLILFGSSLVLVCRTPRLDPSW